LVFEERAEAESFLGSVETESHALQNPVARVQVRRKVGLKHEALAGLVA